MSNNCKHPVEAVFWNPYNKVVQCHICGEVNKKQTDDERNKQGMTSWKEIIDVR